MAGVSQVFEYLFKGDPTDLISAAKRTSQAIGGIDDAARTTAANTDKQFRRINSVMESASSKMISVGKTLSVGVTLPVAYALERATRAAIEDAQGQERLAGQMVRSTDATASQVAAMEDYISKTLKATGVTDDELRDSLGKLLRTTKDQTTAQDYLNVALDVAAATGKPVSDVVSAIAKGSQGATRGFRDFGIATKDAEGNARPFPELMRELREQTDGAAAALAKTDYGQLLIAKTRFGELQEQLGARLVPVLERLLNIVDDVLGFFERLPGPVQDVAIGISLMTGPLSWIGGIGVAAARGLYTHFKSLAVVAEGAHDAIGKVATKTAAASAAAEGLGGRLGGAGRGAHEFTKQASPAVVLLGKLAIPVVVGVSVGAAISSIKKLYDAINRDGKGLKQQAEETIASTDTLWFKWQKFAGEAIVGKAFKDTERALDPKKAREFLDLLAQADEMGGAVSEEAAKIAERSKNFGSGISQLKDLLRSAPDSIDPATGAFRGLGDEMAEAKQANEELFDSIRNEFDNSLNVLDRAMGAQSALQELADTLVKVKTADSDGGISVTATELATVKQNAMDASRAMVDHWMTALRDGQMTEEEAAGAKDLLLRNLQRVKEQVPEAAGQIDYLATVVGRVPTGKREIDFTVNTSQARADIEAFNTWLTTKLPTSAIGFYGATLRSAFNPNGKAKGGVLGFARGGVYGANSGGGITTGPMAVIGEGSNPREYVIPTDYRYRARASALLAMASAELGGGGGGTVNFQPVINVQGSGDPAATAKAVADEIEQLFARKLRTQGSLAFR